MTQTLLLLIKRELNARSAQNRFSAVPNFRSLSKDARGQQMRLKRLLVRNFRSIREATIEIGAQTAILGANGAGKSTILRALDRFYAPSSKVEADDFYGRDPENPIEIALTFCDFTEAERESFGSRIHDDEMTVLREFLIAGGAGNSRFYGMTRQHPEFARIRSIAGARDKRTAYLELRATGGGYGDLPAAQSAADVDQALSAWEQAHPDALELLRDDGQFLGFHNVARGSLAKSTALVFIPAVRDATADAVDGKGSVVARLMELVVRSVVQQRQDLCAFQTETLERFKVLTSPDNLQELGALSSLLTDTLQVFYANAGVRLLWQAVNDFQIPLPAADVYLDDDGFEGPVEGKGHGLQRAFILTLLQHLAKAVAEAAERAREEVAGNAAPPEPAALPTIILAIEEPELYQHPTKQRHFAKVLQQLSVGALPGVSSSTQVVFASHSSLFVAMERFDEIRIARRHRAEGQAHKECRLTASTMAALARRLELATEAAEGSFTADSIKARLHVVDSEVAEGLFADAVVLVEGRQDKAAILAAAQLNGVDLEAMGVAVVAADGKGNLMKPAAVFMEFDVPVFVVWDCDRRSSGQFKHANDVPQNLGLQRLMGRTEELFEASTFVGQNFACFECDLEATLREEIGADVFAALMEVVRVRYGFGEGREVLKTPTPLNELLLEANVAGRRSQTLDLIVERIRLMSAPVPAVQAASAAGSALETA